MMNRRNSVAILIFLILLILSLHRAKAQSIVSLPVVFENGQRSGLSSFYLGSVLYICLDEFADLLKLRTFYSTENKKAVLRVGSRSIKVTAMNPFVIIDDESYQMALSSSIVNDKIFVPLDLFLEIVQDFLPADVAFQKNSDRLWIANSRHNITGIEVEKLENGSFIRVITTRQFQTSHVTTSVKGNWLQVSIIGGSLDSTQIASDNQTGVVLRVVPYQFEGSAQLSFQLNRRIVDRRVAIEKNEIRIDIWTTTDIGEVISEPVAVDRKKFLIDRIIIDPGHGGRFPGTTGSSGVKEKEINLDIAKRLKKLLVEELHVEVLMTREEDCHLDKTQRVDLEMRRLFANSNDGKLFISIHCNGNKNRSVRGFSTYYLGKAKTKEALEVAQKENSVVEKGESSGESSDIQDMKYILDSIYQSVYLRESNDLAGMVNNALDKWTKLPQWHNGVIEAPFLVLVGVAMPSVLVETAFLTNKHEERLLRTKDFRQKLAQALFESIRQFKEKYEKDIK
jgi:N-acetylmuramoyl-L-alanine amidase